MSWTLNLLRTYCGEEAGDFTVTVAVGGYGLISLWSRFSATSVGCYYCCDYSESSARLCFEYGCTDQTVRHDAGTLKSVPFTGQLWPLKSLTPCDRNKIRSQCRSHGELCLPASCGALTWQYLHIKWAMLISTSQLSL